MMLENNGRVSWRSRIQVGNKSSRCSNGSIWDTSSGTLRAGGAVGAGDVAVKGGFGPTTPVAIGALSLTRGELETCNTNRAREREVESKYMVKNWYLSGI